MNKFEYKNLTPFKWFVLENFPFIEADFDALTNWQLFCKLGKEINKIIDSQNVVGEQMENVTNAFIEFTNSITNDFEVFTNKITTDFNELQEYVDNFFTDLNVQEQINNKLDAMAESGELAEIINQEIFGELNERITTNTNNITDMAFIKPSGDTTGETDLANIQNALDTYKKIRLATGNFYINDSIILKANYSIQGAGVSSSIINCIGDISAITRETDEQTAFINLQDIKIVADDDETLTLTKTAIDFPCTLTEGHLGISYSNIERVYIDGFYNGFFAEQFWCTTLKEIRCANVTNYGIFVGGRSNNILIEMPIVTYAENGVRLATSTNHSTELTNINVVNGDFEHCHYGIYAYSVRGLSMKNTYSEYNTRTFYCGNCPSAEFVGFYSTYDERLGEIVDGCHKFRFENGYCKVNTSQKFIVSVHDNSKPIMSHNITIENLNNSRIYITNRGTEINPRYSNRTYYLL